MKIGTYVIRCVPTMLYQHLMLSWGVDVSRYISQLGSWFSAIFEVMVRLCWKKYHFLLIFGDRCFADPFAWYNQVDHWTCDSEECVCKTFWNVSKYPLPQLIFSFKSKSMLLKNVSWFPIEPRFFYLRLLSHCVIIILTAPIDTRGCPCLHSCSLVHLV